MTKWDTIQADVQDQYTYIQEQEAYEQARHEFGDYITDEDLSDVDVTKYLTLDWNE